MTDLQRGGVLLSIIVGLMVVPWVLDEVTQHPVGFIALILIAAAMVSVMLWRALEDL